MRVKLKGHFLIIILILSLLNCFILSEAVSVSPGSIKMDFVPNGVYDGVARFGTGGRTPHLAISTSGDFEIIIDKTEIYCDREPCLVNFKVIMPESFDRPGKHIAHISAKEVFDEGQGGGIEVVVSMRMPIGIIVPYPGKYLYFESFKAENREAGETIPFTAVLKSMGDEIINSAKGTIYIYDRDDNLLRSISTNTVINIEPTEEIHLSAEWDSGTYAKGRYYAFIDITYDGLKINKTTNFKLGGLDVELIGYTKEIIKGGIKPFYIEAESIWSEEINNLKAEVSVLNNNGDEITRFETISKDLPPWGSTKITSYLDTSLLNFSDYNIKITFLFENLTKDYDGNINITKEPVKQIKKKGINLKEIFTTKNVLLIIIAIMVLLLLFLIYMLIFKPKKEKFKKEKDKKKVIGGKLR